MPTVRQEVTVSDGEHEVTNVVDIDFEIWCAECKNGICGNTKWNRKRDNHFTTYCEICVKAKEDAEAEVEELKDKVERLERQVEKLEEELDAAA